MSLIPLTRRVRYLFLGTTIVLLAGAPAIGQSSSAENAVITRAADIRTLTVEQASQARPVRLRGVITDDVPAPDFFVQDSTAGVYVEGSKEHIDAHHFGDLVEIEGVTGPGKFAPVVRESRIRVLGKGVLPKAKLYSFAELAAGQLDSQWAQIRGIVRSASIDRTSWREPVLAMHLASGGGELTVRVPINNNDDRDFSSWVDSEVLIEGVCGSLFNSRRQLSGVLFYVPRLSFIKVAASAREVPIAGLLQFSPRDRAKHRVRVRGVVAYQQLGKALFLESDGRGLRVLSDQSTPLHIGDVVDALGFAAMGESAPVLQDAVFHFVTHGNAPGAIPLDLGRPWESFDGELVQTDAILLDHQRRSDGVHLTMRTGGALFDATLQPESSTGEFTLRNNSQVRVTGICLVRTGGLWSVPESFRVLLRSQDDIVLLRAPSWWNLGHTIWVLAITVGALLIVLAWVVLLGRRVREQMAIIRQKIRSGAVLEERNRIARELHDTLEQELAGITMQLDLAADCFQDVPRVARQAVDTARQMSRHSMIEARRSVWDLRCHLLESGDLVSALRAIVEPLGAAGNVQVEVRVAGEPLRLPTATEMNLLRIGQEAAANAIKHGSATQISIVLTYEPGNVSLTAIDNGHGFVPKDAPSSGHFGLLDMRERARSMGSELHIESAPGQGTRITVKVATEAPQSIHEQPKAHSYSGRG